MTSTFPVICLTRVRRADNRCGKVLIAPNMVIPPYWIRWLVQKGRSGWRTCTKGNQQSDLACL